MKKYYLLTRIRLVIFLIPLLLLTSCEALCGIGKGLLGAAVGYGESKLENSAPEEHKQMYRDAFSAFNNSVGFNSSYVNAGSNWQKGKKNDAILDLTEGVSSSAGVRNTFAVSTVLDLGRAQNNYKKNIESGMSIEEATAILNKEMENYAGRIFDDYMVDDKTRAEIARYNEMQYTKEMREKDNLIRREIWQELSKRGYNGYEAHMYMIYIDEHPGYLSRMYEEAENDIWLTGVMISNDTNIINERKRQVGNVLDDFNIPDRTEQDRGGEYKVEQNSFFGTNLVVLSQTDSSKNDIVEKNTKIDSISETTPKIVDPSENAKDRLKKIAPDCYKINQVELNNEQKELLDEVVSLMNQYPNIRICLSGNTCDLGTDSINELIGAKRADYAKEYLVKHGIDANRIEVKSMSFSNPIVDDHTEEARLRNRRVSISVIDN